tara:strand:+ start:1113 stop:1436 length:324 start_codon:yes stop_codon:yes gene_type:complete
MLPAKRYGHLVTEAFVAPKRFGAITESQAECFWNRTSHWSQFVNHDDALALQYARPNWKHESYVDGTPDDPERCREWVMVYRYYPRRPEERAAAMQASLDYFASKQS